MIRSKRERATRQMRAVLEALREAHDHLTADEVWVLVREKLPKISRATVYRNLQKLLRQGAVAEVHVDKRATRYDAARVPHDHFVCRNCGSVQDVPLTRGGSLPRRPVVPENYVVTSCSVTWYGLCAQCRSVARREDFLPANSMQGR